MPVAACLRHRLDHALPTDKGKGIALPELPQPGETTRAVLNEADDAWLLVFAGLIFSLTLTNVRHAVLIAILLASATAFGYGLLADFSDLLFRLLVHSGIGVVAVVFVCWPVVDANVSRASLTGFWSAGQFLLFGVIYPCLAGLDNNRQGLYLNLSALALITGLYRVASGQKISGKQKIPCRPTHPNTSAQPD